MSKPQPPTKSSSINLDEKSNKADELGTLIVVLLKARNLPDKHSFRKSDVFAQATLNGAQKRTHVDIKGGQRPEWDGEVRFTIMKSNTAKHRKMEVACYSQEPRSEDLMGKGVVDIGETLKIGEFDDWVQLEVDGVARGELYLEMTYYANAPAPAVPTLAAPNKLLSSVSNQYSGLTRRPSKLSPAERLSRPQQQQQQIGRPQNQILASNQQSQGYSISSSNHQPSVTSRPSRLNEQHVPPIREDSTSNSMPGGYPTGNSPQRRQENLPTSPINDPAYYGNTASRPATQRPAFGQQEQSSAAMPTILRPGPGNGSTPTPIPRPQQHQFGHGRHSSDPSFAMNNSHYMISPQNSPPTHNPYISNVSNITPNPQPPSTSNPYLGSAASSSTPYISNGGATSLSPGHVPPRAYSPAPISVNNNAPPITNTQVTSPVQGQPQNPYTGYSLGGQQPSSPPLLWRQADGVGASQHQSNGSFSFPIPAISSGSQPPYDHSGYRQETLSSNYAHRPQPPRDERDFDPYLQTRYQTPLPLPPDSVRPTPPTPATVPGLPRAAYTRSPAPPQKVNTPAADSGRLEALRRAEGAAAERRAQEIRDLELAMQLDRELNLEDERARAAAAR